MSTVTPVHLSQIGQIAINVENPERATNFYRDVLGMKHLFCAGRLSFFDCGGVRLMLTVPERAELRQHSSILYFKVNDLNTVYQNLLAQKVSFEDKPHLIARMPDHELWMTFFRDSENNLLGLMSEIRK
jgi:methylmalonyl-CoA/ethylmalonyl-CoA epimerase